MVLVEDATNPEDPRCPASFCYTFLGKDDERVDNVFNDQNLDPPDNLAMPFIVEGFA